MVVASLSRRSHVIGGVVIFTDLLHSAAWSKWTKKNQPNKKKRLWEKASPTSHWGSVNSERRRQVPHGTKTTEPPLAKIITGGRIKIRRVREVKLQVEKRTCSHQHLDQSKKQPVHHDTSETLHQEEERICHSVPLKISTVCSVKRFLLACLLIDLLLFKLSVSVACSGRVPSGTFRGFPLTQGL